MQVQLGGILRGCRLCDYDVCLECCTSSFIGDQGDSVLNRTLRHTQHSSNRRVNRSFFEAARGLSVEGVADSDGDDDRDDVRNALTHKVPEAQLRYDRAKGRYVKVDRKT